MKIVTHQVATSWADGPMFAFDLETTGANPLTDRLVTASIVLEVPGCEREVFNWLADPDMPIAMEAIAVHGVSQEYAEKYGRDMAAVILEILATFEVIEKAHGRIPLVLVNSMFDLTILNCEIKRLDLGSGLDLRFPIIDTLVIDQSLADPYRTGRRTLTATCSAYKVVVRNAHTSAGDCIAALALARAIARRHRWIGYSDVWSLQRKQRLAAAQRARQFEAYRRSDGQEPDFQANGEWPFIGASVMHMEAF